MTETNRQIKGITQGLKALARVWMLCNGAVIAVILLSIVLPNVYLPLVVFAELGVIHYLIRVNRSRRAPFCYRIPYEMGWTLFWSAVVIVVFNMFAPAHLQTELNGQPYNGELPVLVILIIAPIGFVTSLWFAFRGSRTAFCRDCEARSGKTEERGFLGKIYTQEADYQTRWLAVQWGVLTVVEWVYYFALYINTNLNTPDKFFYIWLPVIVIMLSVGYMGARYSVLWNYYCNSSNSDRVDVLGKSQLRFMVICRDKVWLSLPDTDEVDAVPGMMRVDTPVKQTIKYHTDISTFDASDRFRSMTGVSCQGIKKLYVNSDRRTVSNILHFAVFFDDFEQLDSAYMKGEWFTLADIQMMHQAGILSSLLEAELYRIHTTAMAWKTYTQDGRRRYAVKNYRPTFRLSDMRHWDVDYSDPTWLFVAMNNEDSRFYRLKRLWRKYVSGIGV